MKFSTLNVIIILMILSLSKFSNSFENKKELKNEEKEKSEKNIINKPKKEVDIERFYKEKEKEEKLNEKLEKLSKTDNLVYHQNDKLIENIKKNENKSEEIINHHKKNFIEKSHTEKDEALDQNKDIDTNIEETEKDDFSSESNSSISSSSNDVQKKKKKKKSKLVVNLKKNIIENPIYLNDLKKNKKEVENFKKYTKCNKKSDILYQYLPKIKNTKNDLNTINLKPIFVELNLSSLNIQNGIDSSTLIKTISLKKILRISLQDKLKNFFCFDLILETKDNTESDSIITLCAANSLEKGSWINALQEFKECQLNVQHIDHNDKLLYDFTKVNTLLKTKDKEKLNMSSNASGKPRDKAAQEAYEIATEKAAKTLYYDNTNPAIIKSEATKDVENKVHYIVKRIMKTFEDSRIRENQVKRDMENKLKQAKEFSKDMSSKESQLVSKLNRNVQKAKMQEIKLLDQESKAQELNLLNAVESKVKKMRNDDIKRVKKTYTNQIVNEHKSAEKKADTMMKMIVDAKKFTQYYECTDKKVFKFNDVPYIKDTCKRMFGEYGIKKCANKLNFCEMCCNHHIGISHVNKIFDCKKRCNGLINGLDVESGTLKK